MNLIPYCIERILSNSVELQRQSCYVLCSVLYNGTHDQKVVVLKNRNSLSAICRLLRNGEDITLIFFIILALNDCLKLGDDLRNQQHSYANEVKVILDECGCLNAVKSLTIDNAVVRSSVNAFICGYGCYDYSCSSMNDISDNKSDYSTSESTVKMMTCNENQLKLFLINEDMKNCITELIICEGCGNEMTDVLELCGFKNLSTTY